MSTYGSKSKSQHSQIDSKRKCDSKIVQSEQNEIK